MKDNLDQEALRYHSEGRKGKLEVVPTKPTATQHDLSLAYSPGVAKPCLEIERDPLLAYEYTARGNLVAVISNGTAVLGLGNIGPLAWRLADAEAIGPVLLGMEKPVHVLQRGVEVIDIVNMAAICVVDALEREAEMV